MAEIHAQNVFENSSPYPQALFCVIFASVSGRAVRSSVPQGDKSGQESGRAAGFPRLKESAYETKKRSKNYRNNNFASANTNIKISDEVQA